MPLLDLLSSIGDDIDDPEEETFLLFSRQNSSQDLGIVDAKATTLSITVCGRELNIRQSPTLLSSDREGGTTGAVVWRATPLFAQWIASESNILFRSSVLDENSIVLELGSGAAGIIAIIMACRIGRYIATDQKYVFKLLKANIEDNVPKAIDSRSSVAKHHGRTNVNDSRSIDVLACKILGFQHEFHLFEISIRVA